MGPFSRNTFLGGILKTSEWEIFKNTALPKIRGIPGPTLDQLPSKSNTYQEFNGGTSKHVLIKENKTKRGINFFTAKCATK